MRNPIFAALGVLAISAAPALASGDMPLGETAPASNEMAVWAYPSAQNYCPAGLQPVVVGGVICCGVPTHTGYQSHQAPRRAARPAGTYIATGKGFDEGYFTSD